MARALAEGGEPPITGRRIVLPMQQSVASAQLVPVVAKNEECILSEAQTAPETQTKEQEPS